MWIEIETGIFAESSDTPLQVINTNDLKAEQTTLETDIAALAIRVVSLHDKMQAETDSDIKAGLSTIVVENSDALVSAQLKLDRVIEILNDIYVNNI